MKATRTLLVAALAAAGMAATAYAQNPTARSSSGLNLSGSRTAGTGHGNWNRGGGNWNRGGGNWHGHGRHWHGARWGFYFGAPILWSSLYWGWPHYGYHPYYYPHVIYRDVERYPMSYPEGTMREYSEPTTELGPRTEGAPQQAPLYMNYCESAKAYFPKVTTCPEGWKMISPSR